MAANAVQIILTITILRVWITVYFEIIAWIEDEAVV
jgi:hypothetical protein